ncbi:MULTISPECIES: hypothetical protein [unclassified Sporosarcina]|uniref:hypothetical protein n=1 Tax=unclassified Sporosarcina TaxID=2647733 RepID=UPI00203C0F0B|nr:MULTISPECIES: hypothetical protein [unclassified Sporosarcina]GKV65922.1 hypothetical protein NCCP2331_20750 [Sporosarcina sp. NCCP-2331]GLB56078.1 hypothetical protein NCCP2378_18650 [Sporosarcina sp. NCCP-2378]
MPSTLGNLSSDGQLNRQKSAEAIVPFDFENEWEGPNSRERTTVWHSVICDDHREPKRHT